jgi:glycosyltransferase involved in cell wall biosynthesis
MKVSVIIPCYNYSKYIEMCLLSVLCQKCDYNIEILISDDCSTDNSFNIIERIKKFYVDIPGFDIKCFSHSTNIGEINNTKFLLENATGEYIAYLDADDFWTHPLKLNKQIEFMDNNPDYSLCITGFMQLFENGEYVPTDDFNYWLCPKGDLSTQNLLNSNIVGSSSSRLFRNYDNIFKDYFYKFPYSDWVINFELSLRGKIKYLDFPSYVYRLHENSLSEKNCPVDSTNILKERLNEQQIK